jgi:hypothetical protein
MNREHMIMSDDVHHALKDMVELQMYLVAQPQQRPWPMLSRRRQALPEVREPYRNPIDLGTAKELVELGFIEYTSNITLVVSKSGNDFYTCQIKQQSD